MRQLLGLQQIIQRADRFNSLNVRGSWNQVRPLGGNQRPALIWQDHQQMADSAAGQLAEYFK
jgi:hypothetical protein